MDYMDIDEVLDVPDTPDRLAAQNKNDRGFAGNRNSSPVVCCPENTDISDDAPRSGLRNRIELDEQGNRLPFCPSKSSSSFEKSEWHSNTRVSGLDNSSSSRSSHLSRRMEVGKRANHEGRHFVPSKHLEKGKASCSNVSSASSKNRAIVDLTEQNGRAQQLRKASRYGALKCQTQDIRKGTISTRGFSSLNDVENPENPSTTNNVCKGKEKMDDTCKVVSNLDCGRRIDLVDSQLTAPKSVSGSLHTFTSRRFTSQKRLVRNGCISPHNIAKAKQLTENHDSGSADVVQNDTSTMESASQTNIKDLVAEDKGSEFVKGKVVLNYPHSWKEPDSKSRHLFSRLDGWRSTHNHTNKMPGKGLNLSRSKNDLLLANQQEQSVVRRDNGSSEWICNNYPRHQEPVSHQHGSSSTVAHAASCYLSHFGQINELHHAADALAKRQKQCLTFGDCGQCSTSAVDNSDVVFLGSSGEPSNVTSTVNQSSHSLGNLDSIIEIDEFSPKIRHGGSHTVSSSSNDESDARARQVEADEMLARELQEQLYSESPGIGADEIDAHIALALQQEEESRETFSARGRNVFHPGGSLVSNLRSRNPSIRRGSQARLARRMEQLRSHFRSQSPGVSSRERSSLFHPNVDVDMRIHVLEALEAFSDMGVASQILQVQRDFNEHDYEMLLALDEHNHHVGASIGQINGLPQSTVQSQNFEESCAICLETPTIGDAIRHLPCLHKFHKDCIDPWLRRKTSCPVCKSSIT